MKIKDLQIIAVLYLIVILITFDSTVSFCPFYNLTYLPCFGCGMTRAIQQIIQGKYNTAWKFHLFAYFFFLFLIFVLLTFINKKIYNIIYIIIHNNKILFIIIFLISIYGIIRILILIFFPEIYDNYFEKFNQKTVGEYLYEIINND